MNKLVINTATDELFMALKIGDELFFKSINSKMHHNETMLPEIDCLLKEHNLTINDINEIGVVIGPGSFTGIRVGIATVKAFRDALKVKVKGINNLIYLFKLAQKEKRDIKTVAILGSKDSYFVARCVNDEIYVYEHNLSLVELCQIANGKAVGMFVEDSQINSAKLKQDAEILMECLNESDDENLMPVYYQLSQAENEKFKRANLVIEQAESFDLNSIFELEIESIKTNNMTKEQIKRMISDENYAVFKAKLDEVFVGFVILQITDELNIDSIAVKKEFRNLGIATKLIDKAQDFAKEKGINNISLEVNYKNITAYLLYEKLGFKIRRIRKKYYSDGNDCLEMTKKI